MKKQDLMNKALLAMWAGVGIGDQNRINSQTKPDGVVECNDIPYVDDGNEYHVLDVYYPEGAEVEKLPIFVDIHGGGWVYGTKYINKYYNMLVAKRGFCVVNISYRLAPENTLKEQLEDCFAALKWVMANAKDYPADPDKLCISGDSAGGHLALLINAILNNPEVAKDFDVSPESIPIKAFSITSPIANLNGTVMGGLMIPVITREEDNGKDYKYLNFGDIFTGTIPPVYIVTSNGDLPFVQTAVSYLDKTLTGYGVPHKVRKWGFYNHLPLMHVFSITAPFDGPGKETIDEMVAFLKEYI